MYEENIPVVVRRRGVTMTVRIFGAEDTDTHPPPEPETRFGSSAAAAADEDQTPPLLKSRGGGRRLPDRAMSLGGYEPYLLPTR